MSEKKGWERRLAKAKELRARMQALDKIRDPVVEEFLQLSLRPAASPRRVRDVHDRLQALNKQHHALGVEWDLLWHGPPKQTPEMKALAAILSAEAEAAQLWNTWLSTLVSDD